ncbi:hypothetical protein C7974DRAFT_56839 [Boeremia exigua]|uniref:uncharacterized protein n=1 Tax=Boeremia exigua TaxID=749465 RepID=UPI001E8E932E|nr:uncharacterized protein C7974DRAFT_56839 [Boeremia exigua]KAH6614975.1 hypothetical protein C7974DRAFT_56839 [Boeremia exigua]
MCHGIAEHRLLMIRCCSLSSSCSGWLRGTGSIPYLLCSDASGSSAHWNDQRPKQHLAMTQTPGHQTLGSPVLPAHSPRVLQAASFASRSCTPASAPAGPTKQGLFRNRSAAAHHTVEDALRAVRSGAPSSVPWHGMTAANVDPLACSSSRLPRKLGKQVGRQHETQCASDIAAEVAGASPWSHGRPSTALRVGSAAALSPPGAQLHSSAPADVDTAAETCHVQAAREGRDASAAGSTGSQEVSWHGSRRACLLISTSRSGRDARSKRPAAATHKDAPSECCSSQTGRDE